MGFVFSLYLTKLIAEAAMLYFMGFFGSKLFCNYSTFVFNSFLQVGG